MMVIAAWFKIVILLGVLGAVAAVIAIGIRGARRNPGPSGWMAVVGVIGAILLVIPLFVVRSVRNTTTTHVMSPVTNASTDALAGAKWVDQLAKEGAPVTPHTSVRSAGQFLAGRVADAVAKVGGDGGARGSVTLNVRGDFPTAAAEPIAATLHVRPENRDVAADAIELEAPATKPDGVVVTLSAEALRTTRPVWWPTELRGGTLRADVAGPGGTVTTTAEFADKPWLRANYPGYTTAASTDPESTESAARGHARAAAINRLTPAVRARLMQLDGSDVSGDVVRRHVEAAVNARRGLVDETLVRVDRPYGGVYYAAQLYDFRPPAIDPIAWGAINETRHEQRSWAGMTVALGGMLAVLGVLYAALNALTRGYFRAHLGAALAVVLALGVVVIVLLLG